MKSKTIPLLEIGNKVITRDGSHPTPARECAGCSGVNAPLNSPIA